MSQSVVAEQVSRLPGMNGIGKHSTGGAESAVERLPQSAAQSPPLSEASAKQSKTTLVSLAPSTGYTGSARAVAGQHSHLVSCNPNRASIKIAFVLLGWYVTVGLQASCCITDGDCWLVWSLRY